MALSNMTTPRKFSDGDTVLIHTGKYKGLSGVITSCSPRALLMNGCWSYVVAFVLPNGKKKKKYFLEIDLRPTNE